MVSSLVYRVNVTPALRVRPPGPMALTVAM